MFDEDDHILAAIRAGAAGYLLKDIGPATARTYVSRLLAELDARDRSVIAYEAGLVVPGGSRRMTGPPTVPPCGAIR